MMSKLVGQLIISLKEKRMTPQLPFSYLSPKLELRSCLEKGGYGVFAREFVHNEELLTVWGGMIVTEARLNELPTDVTTHGIQVEESVYMVPIGEHEAADYFNHSCSPNAGMSGQISLIAMRDIHPDEEVCFDYAMSDSSDYDEFICHCGAVGCRKKITGNDWKLPELQRRYQGFFSPYLARRIDTLNARLRQTSRALESVKRTTRGTE
jgi:uncharacterized protein